MPAIENFSVPAGDDVALRFTVAAEDEVTLAGASIKWRVSRSSFGQSIGSAIIQKSSGSGITVVDADARIFDVQLDAEDTAGLIGRYYHEAEITDDSGNKSTVTTGVMTIEQTLIP